MHRGGGCEACTVVALTTAKSNMEKTLQLTTYDILLCMFVKEPKLTGPTLVTGYVRGILGLNLFFGGVSNLT